MTFKIKLTFFAVIFICSQQIVTAQSCNPSYVKGNECVNNSIWFKANAPGFNTYSWEFKDKSSGSVVSTSTDRDPLYTFKKPGTYQVNFTASGVSGNCSKTLELNIKQSPTIDLRRISDTAQCYANNEFCFTDYTTPAVKVVHQMYEFSDGARYAVDTPSFPYTFCHRFIDPKGGNFSVKVTSTDINGCVVVRNYTDFVNVHPKIHLEVTSNFPTQCDSTSVTLTNKSLLELGRVANFCWDWGNGKSDCGDSTTNTDAWTGVKNDGIIHYRYNIHGTFNVTLDVTTNKGCKAQYTVKAAATNVSIKPKLISSSEVISVGEAVAFTNTSGPITGANFLWNFGDPVSGPENTNNQEWMPEHRYSSLGPKMVSLRVVSGPCDKIVFDTIIVQGPHAQIEAAFNRIAEKEKYQCEVLDTVHFTNNSSFYLNDSNPGDEDSTVVVNGKKLFVFNYNETTRAGNQTAVESTLHLEKRTSAHVSRLWDFGDVYANQCTTSTKANINVNKNCNFSTDSLPIHKYPHWDSVYQSNYFNKNVSFTYTYFQNDSCKSRQVDTTEKEFHRSIFYQTIPQDFEASLYLKDSVTGRESVDKVKLITTKPDATKLTIESGIQCALSGNLNQYITFDLGTGGQSYFAVNFDSTQHPNNFIPSTSGGILAPKAPGSPLPFVLPYDLVGNRPTKFVKGYTRGELGNATQTEKDITIGLIVGNGPLGPNGEPPACLDTFWYHNLLHFDLMNPQFEMVGKTANGSLLCKGEETYFKLTQDKHQNIKTFRWNWGEPDRLSGYYEEFHYLEKYTGPRSNRNDKDITYNGEDWLYNYVVRHDLDELYGVVVLDTIVTALVKDYWLEYVPNNILLDNSGGHLRQRISNKDLYKYIGTCIDTTGIGELFEPRAYSTSTHSSVVKRGDKLYRYTNTAHTDSIEVLHVLHFRHHSLQGFDTFIDGTDTTFGVWKHTYTKPEVRLVNGKKDTSIVNVTGAMIPSLHINNTLGCSKTGAKLLNVGHLAHMKLDKQSVCKDNIIHVDDSIRYWQLGDYAYPQTYPIDPRKFWEDPVRYVMSTETKAIDWDASDGIGNKAERSIRFFHQYNEPGSYTITMFTKDSVGCRDTVQTTVEVTGLMAGFRYNTNPTGDPCEKSVAFYDSSKVFTTTGADSVVWYEWNFGDGSVRSVLKNPIHTYKSSGLYKVKLKVFSLLGCIDSVEQEVIIYGPQPRFVFVDYPYQQVYDTATIYERDTLAIVNWSLTPFGDPSFVLNWGDNAQSTTTDVKWVFKHRYSKAGIYYPHLYMEDTVPGSANRCFSYFPLKPNENKPDTTVVVVVLPDSLNSIPVHAPFANVYPNPNTGIFSVYTLPGNTIESVQLTNVFGQQIPVQTTITQENRVEVDCHVVIAGNYFLTIHTTQGTIQKKLTLVP